MAIVRRDDDRMKQQMHDSSDLPWIPLGPGESFKPLRFGRERRVLLLRLEPGTEVPRHRHLGEVHAFNVTGKRKLDAGEIVGPGGYVYEPAGNVDSWIAIGDEPVVIHITSHGAMQYLGDGDEVLRTDTATSLRDVYLRYCADHGIAPRDLGGER